ncbi:MAG: hypothetical protein ACE5JN_08245 [Candidatus Methylomirabilia bacterium]
MTSSPEGLACTALGGFWSWLLDGQPFPDLDRVDWCERDVLLVRDSDVWVRRISFKRSPRPGPIGPWVCSLLPVT